MSSIKKNFSYSAIYQILLMLLPFVTIPYISRVLGVDGVGIFSYTYSISSYFLLFAMLGVKNYGNREIAMVRNNKNKLSDAFWNIYGLQLITSIIVSIAYTMYVVLFVQEYMMMAMIQVICVISGVFDISWFFFGLEKFKLTVTRNIIIKIMSVCAVFLFVKTSSDLWIYAVIMSVGTLLSHIVMWPFLKNYISLVRPTWSKMIFHLKPNLLLFIPVIAISLYKIMDKVMLGSMNDVSQVGLYESAEKIINLPLGLIVAFGGVMLPRMSNLVAKGDIVQSQLYLKKSMLVVLFLSSALTFGIAGIAPNFAPFFFGEEFVATGQLITYLAPTIIIISWANVIRTQFLIPNKKDKVYIISVILGAVVNLILNIILIPNYGAIGAVIGTLVAEFVVAITQTILVRKELDVKNYIKDGIPFMIIGFTMFVIVRLVASFEVKPVILLIIQVTFGIIIYLGISYVYLLVTNKKIPGIFPNHIFRGKGTKVKS